MFKVGFEFEIATELDKQEVRKMLKTDFPDWHKEIKIVRDYTFAGWELVTLPYSEDIADLKMKQLLAFITAHSDLGTDKYTAFHVNISFNEVELNDKIDIDSVYAHTDINKVLKSFNRVLNTYCRSPKNYHFYEFIQFNNLEEVYKFTNDNTYRTKRINELKQRFKQEVKGDKKNVPIADKHQNGKRYFEFRMMGNKDYHKKTKLINKYIEHFKSALVLALEEKE